MKIIVACYSEPFSTMKSFSGVNYRLFNNE